MGDSICFDLYRYQIIPMAKKIQLKFSNPEFSDVIRNKNKYFQEFLIENTFLYRRSIIQKNIEILHDNKFKITIGKESHLKIYNTDFTPEKVDSYPPTRILIDNDKEVQLVAVERTGNFSNTSTVVNEILAKNINKSLNNVYLTVKFSPVFNRCTFWEYIEKYQGEIKFLRFKLITPNMSNISGVLSEEIKRVAKNTCSAQSELKIMADSAGTLRVDKDDADIDSLVAYTAKGGGTAHIKAKRVAIQYSSDDNQMKIEADDFELKTNISSFFPKIKEVADGGCK